MVTPPGRTTVSVTSHPSIHFLLKTVAVVETLDVFMDSLTLISFSFFCVYGKKLNFHESYFISAFGGGFFFFLLLFALIYVPKSFSEDGFSGCPPEISAVLRPIQRKFHLTTPPIYFSIREINVGSFLIQIKLQ